MRDLPRAIAISCVIVLLIYVLTIVSFHTTLSTAEVTFPPPFPFYPPPAKHKFNLETVQQNLLLMLSQQTLLKHHLANPIFLLSFNIPHLGAWVRGRGHDFLKQVDFPPFLFFPGCLAQLPGSCPSLLPAQPLAGSTGPS